MRHRHGVDSANGIPTRSQDRRESPVSGSPVADVIAYPRLDNNNISRSAKAKKDNSVSLRETLAAAPDGETLTLTCGVFVRPQIVPLSCSQHERAIAAVHKSAHTLNRHISRGPIHIGYSP